MIVDFDIHTGIIGLIAIFVGLGSIILGLIFLHITETLLNDDSETWACNGPYQRLAL